ncbi:MAG: phosphoribosylamine--glycine ligase [Candidatus Nanopelagicales bacterium]|nr:phosphoribosylamine--glycine ligase [Candidatus Nanopelagicales bacterium]
MKCLVIGSGAREHAITASLLRDPGVSELLVAPGNAGIEQLAPCRPIDVTDPVAIADLAVEFNADLVVIGPEVPLMAGAANELAERGIPCFGPHQEAAFIEGSKAFCKEVMAEANIPTAMAHVCDTEEQVVRALDSFGAPYVVKDDGLAAGKGVVVTSDRNEALEHARACLATGNKLVIEEFLDGPEVSLFGISDGTTVIPLQPAQDFKRVGEGDTGLNTGGMGAYSPLPWVPAGVVAEVTERVLQPMATALKNRGTPFVGVLYAGLAMTSRGIRVIEFNARFGDPETQVVLDQLETPLGEFLVAAATGRLAEIAPLVWRPGYSVTVVIAAAGYPSAPATGDPITGIDLAEELAGVTVYHAGTQSRGGELVTSGGRVLSVTAHADTLEQAREQAQRAAALITISGSHFRRDIAQLAAQGRISLQ